MNIEELNTFIEKLSSTRSRDTVFELAFSLIEWMGLQPVEDNRPRLLSPQTQKLKEYLVPVPLTVQPQLYRLTADGQHIRIRFAALKKTRKEYLSQLVDNDPGLTSYQASIKGIVNLPDRPAYIPSEPYFIHFITTPGYDKLILVFNQGDQKRIITFRNRLTQTQYYRIVQQWKDIALRSKPEIVDLFWQSLDVKEVNKEFYRKIKERFDDLVGFIKASDNQSDENHIGQFAIRLIGRYVFCWFLKEKGIIPAELISSSTIEQNRPGYYKNFLLRLFFQTLNTEVQQRNFLIPNHPLDALFLNIPYLDGGLFEDFTEDKSFHMFITDDWLIAFVKVLESYDFTVDESSMQYQQVAIDPEMLGRIFENLLASQNPETEKLANQRKAFGAFYTPREIVEYMVDASLKAYLEQVLMPEDKPSSSQINEPVIAYSGTLFQELESQQTEILLEPQEKYSDTQTRKRAVEKIEKLFLPGCDITPFDKRVTLIIQNALRDIKVLDPACGSGAFPISMLLRLMNLREIIGSSLNSPYELKSEILSRNIYGVDIMPMAVEIARLRAWLSLVLEVDYKPADRKHNFNIKALPNLDFKFICAHSLIDIGYDDLIRKIEKSHGATVLVKLDNEIQKLQRLREQYFDTRGDKAQKYTLQHEFHRTKELIKTEYSSFGERWKIESFLEQVDDWNPFDDSHTSSFFSPGWMFGINDGFDVVIANPPYVGQKGHKEIFQQIKDSELGRLYHQRRMNLFYFFIHQSLINLKTSGILTFITTNYYLTATYADKLRKHIYDDATILSLINFNELKVFESAQGQHNLITMLKKGKFLEVIAKTCITQKQGIANESVIAKIINGEDPDTEYNKQSQKSLFEGGTLYIRIESQKKSSSGANNVFAILNKMKVGSDLLCKYCEIEQGIVSGADKVSESHIKDYPQYNLQKGKGIYVLTNKEISDLGFTNDDKKYLKKTYKNSEIRKWVVSAKDDLNVIYIKSDGEYFEPNIRIKNHLDGFKIILINRNVRVGSITEKDYQEFLKDKKEISYIMNASSMKKGNYYCLSYARRALDTFEVLKIVNSRRAYSNTFALEDKGYYEQSDIVVTTLKPEYVKTINIKYFLAILNSKLLYAWLYHKGKRKGEQLEIFQKPLSEVPVKVGSFSIQEKIVSLVNNIFEAKKTNSNVETDKCEKEIDILVYKLYGLTHNEVKIIDPDFWLSEEEYKKFGVK